MPRIIRTQIQKRFSDVDMLQHVNVAAQQTYYDTGKTDYYVQILGRNVFESNTRVVIVNITTSFIDQIRFTDNVTVETSTEKVGTKSITLLQRIVDSDNGTVKSESRTTMVAFDFALQCAVEVPDTWRKRLLGE